MKIKSILRKDARLRKIYSTLYTGKYCVATMISPVLNTKYRYKDVFGKLPNLEEPKTLEEKLVWLKLNNYIKNPLVIQCADKVRVREYVKSCGLESILNDVYGVYQKANEIDWNRLPNKFVLKWNFGAGYNIVCNNKEQLNIKKTIKQMNRWGKKKCWLPYSEMQYKYAPKRIICEKFLEDQDALGAIPDYKVYCFGGVPRAILVMHDRGRTIKGEFFDCNWNELKKPDHYVRAKETTKKPDCLEEMLEASRILSSPFPFVRCDYYIVNGKIYFGELTFTPAGGIHLSKTDIDGKDMSEYLDINYKE